MESVQREVLARAIHEGYRKEQAGRLAACDPSMAEWDDLPETLRESNRRQADDIERKLAAIGYCVVVSGGEAAAGGDELASGDELAGGDKLAAGGDRCGGKAPRPLFFSDDEVEIMAEMEHDRWSEERLRDGWVLGEEKDVGMKITPYLVPWAELSDEAKEWDRQPVRRIPEMLSRVSLEIKKIENGGRPPTNRSKDF